MYSVIEFRSHFQDRKEVWERRAAIWLEFSNLAKKGLLIESFLSHPFLEKIITKRPVAFGYRASSVLSQSYTKNMIRDLYFVKLSEIGLGEGV